MILLTIYSGVWLAWLCGLSSVLYLVFWGALKLWRNPKMCSRRESRSWKSLFSIVGHVGSKIFLAAFFVVCGYILRDLKQFHHTYVLSDVSVLRKDSPEMYLMETDQHQPFEFRFCEDFVPHLEPGYRLKVLVYEDRVNCKSVSDEKLGFIIARDRNGKPIKE